MNKSETIGSLATALAKAQGDIKGAIKDSDNPFFKRKYADLSSVWDACREPLSKNGLCIIQTAENTEGCLTIETILAHASGEWVSSRLLMKPVKDDPQGVGSAITYARRYALAAIAGVAPEDDDGNAASGNNSLAEANPRTEAEKKYETNDDIKISDAQRKRFYAIAKKHNKSDEEIKNYLSRSYGLTSTKDLTTGIYDLCVLWAETRNPGEEG